MPRMSRHRLNRRGMLKALGYGGLIALTSACGNDTIRFVTATSSASEKPFAPPLLPTLPATTAPEPTSPSPTSPAEPSPALESSATPEAPSSLFQPVTRPARVMGFHVPYEVLERPIDFAVFEGLIVGTGANCAVIDIKVEGGKIAIPFEHYLKPSYTNNPGFDYDQAGQLLNWLVERGYYPVARLVVMNDTPLATTHEELAYHFHSPQAYTDNSGEGWVNPERPEVGDYNAAVAVAAAQMGFREIQLDYIRYPEADFDKPIEQRVGAIFNTLAIIRAALGQQALLAIDVLDDSTITYPENVADGGYGQRIATLAQTVDVVCPMLYPDMYHQNIDVDYYQTVYDGVARTIQKVALGGATALVNPWIQAYYAAGLPRIRQQATGAFQAGAVGVFAWNISLNYPHGMFVNSE